jgi:hypothetical protein
MSKQSLARYLSAHLAGSVGALELLDSLERRAPGAPQRQLVSELRSAIESAQTTLRAVMDHVGAEENRLEQAGAWLGEKLARARLAVSASEQQELGWMEGLETLGLGLQGQAALWRALATVRPGYPGLAGFDFDSLARTADALFAGVDRERLTAAKAAFAPGA